MNLTSVLALPDLGSVADGRQLVREIEHYLATHTPVPVLTLAPAARVCAYGQAPIAWDRGMVRPVPTLLDRLRHRPPTPVPIDTATHLLLVSRYLVAYGWCQNTMWDAQGRRCILGAQLAVLQGGYGTPSTVQRARTLLMEQFTAQDPEVRTVDQWNDAPGRTAAQVHRQLDIAASRAQHLTNGRTAPAG
ncbi:DUF6197 family protein [Streptacidiphilus carbonis]|uniref:DUF6197 family protein n=1 Tax=Streptacidiphilus carbonis TaxID=105422 RepID=UPI0006941A2D|nr:hypothetical protein [Streptacidiphilus carbonis]